MEKFKIEFDLNLDDRLRLQAARARLESLCGRPITREEAIVAALRAGLWNGDDMRLVPFIPRPREMNNTLGGE